MREVRIGWTLALSMVALSLAGIVEMARQLFHF